MGVTASIGTIGTSLFLIAFVLNLVGLVGRTSALYLWLNLLGGVVACLASILIKFYPFVVLDAVWAAAAGIGLVHQQQQARRADMEP